MIRVLKPKQIILQQDYALMSKITYIQRSVLNNLTSTPKHNTINMTTMLWFDSIYKCNRK